MTSRIETKLTIAQVKTRIRNISKRVASNYEHETAVECMRHAYKHGDTTLFLSLVYALLGPSGRRKGGLAMIKWGREYFPIVIKQDESNLRVTLKKDRSEGDWLFDKGIAHPFDEASDDEAAAVIFDTEALLKIVTSFSNRENTTPEAHTIAKTLVDTIKEATGRVTPDERQLAVA